MKKILAIGGSQFVGRVFAIYASRRADEFELHVLNRGRYPLRRPEVTEYVCDRNDTARMAELLGGQHFDAIVDFCAYEPGHVRAVAQAGISCDQYVLITTANVFEQAAASPGYGGAPQGEPAERALATAEGVRADAALPDQVKDYIIGKLQLEDEARELPCPCTLLRPAFVYGPFDYSNRMAGYFKAMKHGLEMPFPVDSTSRFSFIYVKDFANMLLALIGDERTFDRAFTVAHPQPVDWEQFEKALTALTGGEQNHAYYPVETIVAENLPIPFPVDTDESYPSRELVDLLGLPMTPFEQGLRETWDIFKDLV